MSSLQTRLSDLITAVGTDIKQLRVWMTGSSSGDLTGLTTTAKTSLVAAINEVKAAATGAPPAASQSTAGVAKIATSALVTAGTDDTTIVSPLGLATRLVAAYQPLDSDLTSIAALTTTAYGRAFLALTNQAGLMALLSAATSSAQGIIQLATQTEVNTGTDAAKAVTSLTLQTRLAAYAMPVSYLDTDGALAANSDTKVPSQKAVKAYADGLLDANNAYQYKGGIDASTSPNYPAASAGWTYKITVAGKIGGAAGINVEVGDTATCLVDGSAAGTQAAVGANWLVMQTNIDGAVTGPTSSTAGDIPTFSGTTGKVVADSGVAISTDGTMAANVDTKVPTEKAVLTYTAATFYTQAQLGNPDTDLAGLYTTAKT